MADLAPRLHAAARTRSRPLSLRAEQADRLMLILAVACLLMTVGAVHMGWL